LVPAAAACLIALAACATFSDTIKSTERSLAQQQPRLALAEYEKRKPGSADRVLHLMNKGMLLRMAGDYEQSTRALEEAKGLIDELRAVSLREQALSIAVNDAAKSFIGDDFEQVMVHTYLALNYLERQQLEAARVEALQVDVLLRQMAEGSDSPYVEDAFARYLTGIVYEDQREWSDAMIAYRKAYETYQGQLDRFGVALPETLKHDLIRLADRMQLREEAARYREAFGITDTPSTAALLDRGEIILTVHAGLAPAKRENAAMVLNPGTGRMLRLALPQYRSREQPFAFARVSVDTHSVTTSRVENIDAIAVKSLEAKMPAITARALARMIVKDRVAKEAGNRGGGEGLLGLVVNIANVATERADTRSWFTLPGEIHLARISLPPGKYRGRIEFHGRGGGVLQSSEFEVALGKGEKRYLSRHWIPTNLEVKP
jgi:tetratricopeptide (TPR) repeat protein